MSRNNNYINKRYVLLTTFFLAYLILDRANNYLAIHSQYPTQAQTQANPEEEYTLAIDSEA